MKLPFIKNCYLFVGLDEEALKRLDRITKLLSFKKGSIIFQEGEKAEGFFLLCQGRVKIYKLSAEGKEQLLHVVHPGETFADAAVFEGSVYPAMAQAMDDSTLIFIDNKSFLEILKDRPEIGLRMLGNMSRYLHHFLRMVEDLSLKEISSRLAEFLLQEAGRKKVPSGRAPVVELEISKTDLAASLGTVSETLSRTLRKLRDRNIIGVEGKRITLLDVDALEEISQGKKL